MAAIIVAHEKINDDYEWIQYNEKLRLIRSVKDDMYQMQSIIEACRSNKLCADWFKNQPTRELLSQFELDKSTMSIPIVAKSHENRMDLANGLRGYYIHRLLVNAVAMWASPRYALDVFVLLDKMAEDERKKLETKVDEQKKTIDDQKPRMVPKHKDKSYKYMIWKEDAPEVPDVVILHLVKRNNTTFRSVSKIKNDPEKCWFYRESLPISMTVNEDIKELVKQILPGSEYGIKGSNIRTYKKNLDKLHEAITEYIDSYREEK